MIKQSPILSLIIIFVNCSPTIDEYPNTFRPLLYDIPVLKKIKNQIRNNDEARLPAYYHLINRAESVLPAGPFSVVFDDLIPPSGDKNDYASMGPYWWPNPETLDGLPYIRRDGQINPERIKYDKIPIASLGEAVSTLALAYYFTEDERYAHRVATLLRIWFIDPETLMNPNLDYGQFIPGRSAGRGVGIIESRVLIYIAEALSLIRNSPSWTDSDQQKMSEWYSEYLEWLVTSSIGADEKARSNNHGTWYNTQVACLALQTGQRNLAERHLTSIIERRIPEQIEADGRQHLELERTRTLTYTKFNLTALTTAARLGGHLGLDIWNATNEQGGNIAAALSFLATNAVEEGPWPFKQITSSRDNFELISLIILARDRYDHDRYTQVLEMLPQQDRIISRENLLRLEPVWTPMMKKLQLDASDVINYPFSDNMVLQQRQQPPIAICTTARNCHRYYFVSSWNEA